ncbi:TPA: Paratox [Streptococcus pyogenes]|nr:Paratox [Streptococcus pyogenes]HEQ2211406.1 Paratox [Streptococcus pyogenes]HEQ2220106.1 Paratox [Streptococcus pyogenes]HEQ3914638.1 Paratox [Streptococcus pyogenes]HEQ5162488.1 Paratox [Streptococcus pyogenes]
MLTYDEFKQAIDNGYIAGDTVAIVRKDGQIFDYVLPNEKIRDWEVVTEEKVEEVMVELDYIIMKKTLSRQKNN